MLGNTESDPPAPGKVTRESSAARVGIKRIKVFWFFFQKEDLFFFEKKNQKLLFVLL